MKAVRLNLLIAMGLILLWCTPAESQFVKTLGGASTENGFSVVQTSDGGFVVTGYTTSFGAGSYDLLLSEFDASGNHVWSTILGGTGVDCGSSVIQTSDGGFMVTGYTQNFGAGGYDLLLSKFDGSGKHLWSRTLGGTSDDLGFSVVLTSDGGFVVTGQTLSFGAGSSDLLLSKFDSTGNYVWSRTLGGTAWEVGNSVVQTSDGGFVVTGLTSGFGAGANDLLLSKFDASGNHLWSRTLGGGSHDEGQAVIQTSDGGFVVTGYTTSFGAGSYDLLLSKFDASGTHLWSKTLGRTGYDVGYSVIQTSDGGLVVTGLTASFGPGDYDLLLSKFDASGNHLWSRTLEGANDDWGRSVVQTSDGGFVVTGYTSSFGVGGYDLLLAKFDASGNTCLGEFVAPIVQSISPTVTSPTFIVNSPTPTITSPSPTVTSPTPTITEVCEVQPRIISINDVGNDQGRQVRVKWHRCYYDTVGLADTITEYGIWRRVDQYKGSFPGQDFVIKQVENPGQMLENIANSKYGDRYRITETGDLWDFIATVPAMQFEQYVYDAPTECDSTICAGICWSVFFVAAHTKNPTVHYDSDPDSGYSLDNIFKCGDVNGDITVNASDVVYLINYLFIGGPPPVPMAVGDVNCDGKVNVTDVVYLINSLFVPGSPPPCGS